MYCAIVACKERVLTRNELSVPLPAGLLALQLMYEKKKENEKSMLQMQQVYKAQAGLLDRGTIPGRTCSLARTGL